MSSCLTIATTAMKQIIRHVPLCKTLEVKLLCLHQEPSPGEIIFPEIKGACNPQIYHGDGIKILSLDFTIYCCGIFDSIILIVLCIVNH